VTSQYAEYPYGAGWEHFGARWSQRVTGSQAHHQLVLPDGAADIIVDEAGQATLVGPSAEVAVVPVPAGSSYRSLRLRPGALRSALDVPAVDVRGRTLPLADVVGPARSRELTRAALGSASTILALQRNWLHQPRDRRITGAIDWLRRHPDRDVAQLAADCNLSPRQLRRILLEHAGLGPKELQRVFRLHRFLAVAEAPAAVGLAESAPRAGYADQPHLTREVRALSGMTPSALLRHRRVG
jgi:AraC-like DNA-binding protein